jgi:hypothetical protein
MRKHIIALAGVVLLLCISCDNTTEERTISITSNRATLSQRVDYKDQPISLTSNSDSGDSNTSLSFRWVARIHAPKVGDNTLAATSVSYNSTRKMAAIGYKDPTDDNLGSVDLLQTSLTGDSTAVILSNAQITRTDVNDVHLVPHHMYMAVSSDDPAISNGQNRAVVEYLNIEENRLLTDRTNRTPITGSEALTVTADTSRVFLATGPNGGMAVFNSTLNALAMSSYIENARAVDYSGEYMAALAVDSDGDNYGMLHIYNRNTFSYIRQIEFEGHHSDQGRADIQIVGNNVAIAAGSGGTQFYSITTGERLGYIARPNPIALGYGDDQVLTNAIAISGDIIFISNKMGGISVAKAGMDIRRYPEGEPIDLTLLGTLDIDAVAGITDLEYANGFLWYTDGLQGTNLIEVSQ